MLDNVNGTSFLDFLGFLMAAWLRGEVIISSGTGGLYLQ
jgi:hypothetical protein